MAEVATAERSTAGVLVKFTPGELAVIDRHVAKAGAGVKRGPWMKGWLAKVCESLDRQDAAREEDDDGD